MAARFVLSLDCEGKWGVADSLTASHRCKLTDDRLAGAYDAILRLLDEYDIAATFAFAGLFSQTAAQFARLRPLVEAFAKNAPDYLRPALHDIDASQGSGWHGAHLVGGVTSARAGHEIALHGVTHVPWTSMSEELAEAELALFERLEAPVRQSQTFVYPRNLVAHVDMLERRGMLGYRTATPGRSRAASLASEFNIFPRPESPVASHALVPIPGGFFLNWRSGPRRLIPPAVTLHRARRLLDRAISAGEVVHYWLHPENIATAPATLSVLRGLIEEVARRRDAGTCEVLTQLDYCHWVRSLA